MRRSGECCTGPRCAVPAVCRVLRCQWTKALNAAIFLQSAPLYQAPMAAPLSVQYAPQGTHFDQQQMAAPQFQVHWQIPAPGLPCIPIILPRPQSCAFEAVLESSSRDTGTCLSALSCAPANLTWCWERNRSRTQDVTEVLASRPCRPCRHLWCCSSSRPCSSSSRHCSNTSSRRWAPHKGSTSRSSRRTR